MSDNIALPFRLGPSGAVVTNPQGSEDYYISQIAVVLMTERGERLFEPRLGIANMTYDGFSKALLDQQIGMYLPGIKVSSMKVNPLSDTVQDVNISFGIVGGS